MSSLSEELEQFLKKLFPHNILIKEHYIRYKNQRLFFDFYLKDLKILFEVQGRQHCEFVKHFHTDIDGFKQSKFRDNLKIQYAEEQGLSLVYVYFDEVLSDEFLLNRISEAIDGRHYNKRARK